MATNLVPSADEATEEPPTPVFVQVVPESSDKKTFTPFAAIIFLPSAEQAMDSHIIPQVPLAAVQLVPESDEK